MSERLWSTVAFLAGLLCCWLALKCLVGCGGEPDRIYRITLKQDAEVIMAECSDVEDFVACCCHHPAYADAGIALACWDDRTCDSLVDAGG